MNNHSEIRTLITIIGAGPGGASAALRLSDLGINCQLIDKAVFPRDKVCGDAISGKSVHVLKKLNLLDQVSVNPIQLPSWGIDFVAPNLTTLSIPFKNPNTANNSIPGFISKRIDFDDFLIREVRKRKEIEFLEGMEILDQELVDNAWHLKTNNGLIISKLVIVANGAHSSFSKKIANIHVEPKHYCAGLRAYYKNVSGLHPQNFIELHFLKDFLPGYFWIFPLPGGFANVGVGMRSDKVSSKKINLKKSMLEIIQNAPHLKERFNNAELIGDIKGYGLPLGSKKRKLSGTNYMLTGDAASLIDPFTGEGIGNAMESGYIAADIAKAAFENNNFSAEYLSAYDQKVYSKFWQELKLSYKMQQLVNFPWLFNLVVNKAASNKTLSETISCMFNDMDLREKLKSPSFYFKLLFN